MGRTIIQIAALVYLLTVPAGVYVFLSRNSGYPSKMGGLLVVGLALVGIVLVVVFERHRVNRSDD